METAKKTRTKKIIAKQTYATLRKQIPNISWDVLAEIFDGAANYCNHRKNFKQPHREIIVRTKSCNKGHNVPDSNNKKEATSSASKNTTVSDKKAEKQEQSKSIVTEQCSEDLEKLRFDEEWKIIKSILLELNGQVRKSAERGNGVDIALIDQLNQSIIRFDEIRSHQLVGRLLKVARDLQTIAEETIEPSKSGTLQLTEQTSPKSTDAMLKRDYTHLLRAISELKRFGIVAIMPSKGDKYDNSTMLSMCGAPDNEIAIVERVVEYGYAQEKVQSTTPTVIKKALVELKQV